MNKIIPFENTIKCDTSIYEITSISLDKDLSFREGSSISGEFEISGTYKMLDTDIKDYGFSKTIPIDVVIDEHYDTSNSTIEIDDFHYEIIDDDSIKIHIDLLLDGLEEIIPEQKNHEILDIFPEEVRINSTENVVSNETVQEIIDDIDAIDNDDSSDSINNNSLFTKFLDDDDTYSTYKVYIMREQDTLESILEKYNVKREDLEVYNDLENIHISDKIIIPYYEKD